MSKALDKLKKLIKQNENDKGKFKIISVKRVFIHLMSNPQLFKQFPNLVPVSIKKMDQLMIYVEHDNIVKLKQIFDQYKKFIINLQKKTCK
jgi:hypothetical protein